jgi:lipopolysaccharide kinase (Kdo/WaaP) family protein
MTFRPDYQSYTEGEWKLWVLDSKWTEQLRQIVLATVESRPYSKHPQTVELDSSDERYSAGLFLKVFHGSSGPRALKELLRDSNALRSVAQAAALAKHNFNAPVTVAAGEKRKYGWLRKAFVLSAGVNGRSLTAFLEQRYALNAGILVLSEKRDALKRLAVEVQRLHQFGFVHGDLVPTNIFVSRTSDTGTQFVFMDNDRTRHFPRWFPQTLWRRNLVQLNRMPLPGITLQDRVRFLRQYLGSKESGPKERRLLSWLERKTRQRRRECDSVDSRGSFRRLMRWDGKLA